MRIAESALIFLEIGGGMCISVLSHRQWNIEEKHNIQLIWVSMAGLVPSFWELLDLDEG